MGDGEASVPRLVTCETPSGQMIVKSHRSTLEVLQLIGEKISIQSLEADADINTLCLASNAAYLCCGCDDKSCIIWKFDGESFAMLKRIPTPKRPCAATFTTDSKWIIVADKYGDVYGFCLDDVDNVGRPILLFGHLCTIISALGTTSDGSYVFSGDSDGKIRISLIPPKIENGIHEIQSFCLSHKSYVSAVVELSPADSGKSILVSGGGDGLLKAWNLESGLELGYYEFSETRQCPPQTKQDEENKDSDSCEVTAIEKLDLHGQIAVAVDWSDIHIMKLEKKNEEYQFHHQYRIDAENISVIAMCYSPSLGELWAIGRSAKISIFKTSSSCSKLSLASSLDERLCDFCAEDERLRNQSSQLVPTPWKRRRTQN